MSEEKLRGLQKVVREYLESCHYIPPWQSAGAHWAQKIKELQIAWLDSQADEETSEHFENVTKWFTEKDLQMASHIGTGYRIRKVQFHEAKEIHYPNETKRLAEIHPGFIIEKTVKSNKPDTQGHSSLDGTNDDQWEDVTPQCQSTREYPTLYHDGRPLWAWNFGHQGYRLRMIQLYDGYCSTVLRYAFIVERKREG